jgi:magnesium-transporting ATPase (P-type)
MESLSLSIDGNSDAAAYTVQGDPTEACILSLAVSLQQSARALRRLTKDYPRVAEIPFDSETKYMASMHVLDAKLVNQLIDCGKQSYKRYAVEGVEELKAALPAPNAEGKYKVIFVKGAPEKIVAFCQLSINKDEASVTPFMQFWSNQAMLAASKGMRVLGLAYKLVDMNEAFDGHIHACSGFTMTGLVGIMDPPRPEAIEAIKVAQGAGICVKMITGDHPVTALSIGKMLGLNNNQRNRRLVDPEAGHEERAIIGSELDRLLSTSVEEFDRCVVENDIFARATPEHKICIVQSLKRQGYVCSMTGDGVNDAPALKAADIGVAMGITGTEVAKEASSMVLTDDNFATIVEAIRIGRGTYKNLIKIITFVLPTNGGQAFSIVFALIIDVEVPITALQILWVNMITSVTMGLVLAFDKPNDDILEESPRVKNKRLFGRFLTWRLIFVATIITASVLTIVHWESSRIDSIEMKRTVAVNCLSVCQMAYVFNCRNLRRNSSISEILGGNIVLYFGLLAVIIFQVLFTYAPGFQYVFSTRSMDGTSWGLCIIFAIGLFILVELEKFCSTMIAKHRQEWFKGSSLLPVSQDDSLKKQTKAAAGISMTAV